MKKRKKMQIYVGNMSYQTTEESITELFSKFGEVEKVTMIKDRETQRPKGFGFISMNDNAAATKAIEELNQQEFEGRTLKINEAQPREERPRRDY